MMSAEQIAYESDKAARVAARQGKRPYVPWNLEELDTYPPFPFPFIGSFSPPGWTEIDSAFVDSSGFGQDDEPALSASQFKHWLAAQLAAHPGVGFAVTAAGEFQVYVAAFVPAR